MYRRGAACPSGSRPPIRAPADGPLPSRRVRPGRSDIPLPPFPPGLHWVGPEPPAAERLTARGPLLVHFFEAGELSSVRTLTHVDSWARRYADAGLTTIGVHTPRSDLARSPQALERAVARLGLSFPVANDADFGIWHAYGCKGWPSMFLWGRGGTLRWFHFGLGGQPESEEQIRIELRAGDEGREGELPERAEDSGAERVELQKPSDEVFPGGSHETPWTPAPGEPLEVSYGGAGASASLDGRGAVAVAVDGQPAGRVEVTAPGVYRLCDHGSHGLHEVRLDLEGDVRVWSVAFAPGPAER